MTTATDSPLLALLGKGAAGPAKPGVADVDDKRALDAALEFAALLLDAGGLDAEADAQTLGGHPRQLRQVDGTALDTAVTRVLDYLQNIDRAGARRGRILNLAALIAFQILVILVVFVIWLVWRGYV